MSFDAVLRPIGNGVYNSILCVGYLSIGATVAKTVNEVAAKLFSPKDGSNSSNFIKNIAVIAGTTVAAALSPHVKLFTFTNNETLALLAIDTALVTTLYLQYGNFMPWPLITAESALVGNLGAQGLAAAGAIGAVMGAYSH